MKAKILLLIMALALTSVIASCSKQSADKQEPATDGQMTEQKDTMQNTTGGC